MSLTQEFKFALKYDTRLAHYVSSAAIRLLNKVTQMLIRRYLTKNNYFANIAFHACVYCNDYIDLLYTEYFNVQKIVLKF